MSIPVVTGRGLEESVKLFSLLYAVVLVLLGLLFSLTESTMDQPLENIYQTVSSQTRLSQTVSIQTLSSWSLSTQTASSWTIPDYKYFRL